MGREVKGKGREKGGRGGKREGPPCSQPPPLVKKSWIRACVRLSRLLAFKRTLITALSFHFIHFRSVMRVFYTVSPFINWIQIWHIWKTQLRWDKFWNFFFCNNSTVACAQFNSMLRFFSLACNAIAVCQFAN